jgi:hypothetical protein
MRPPAEPKSEPAVKTKQVVAQPPAPKTRPTPVRTAPRPTPAYVGKLGDKLIGKVWDAAALNDRRLARLCAADSPAAAAIRLYGPSGAAWAVGVPPAADLVAVAARVTTVSSGVRHASNGYVETAAGHRFPFLLRWQALEGTALIDEILPYDGPLAPAHLSRWLLGPGWTGVHAPPQPRIPLGPVGELLWRRVNPTFGMPCVLRCLAALWRLPDDGVLLDSHGPAAVAAGIERMVCHRANLTTGRFADVAEAYRIKEAALRAAGADLQKSLRLDPERWW